MIYDYNEDQKDGENSDSATKESEFFNAKSYLQTASKNSGDNLYDHLTEVLNKILAERPENIIDFFEEYSRKVKEQRFKSANDRLEDVFISPAKYDLANKVMQVLQPPLPKQPSTVDLEELELVDMSKNNMLELLYYLEQAGLGLPKQEMVFIMISMKKIASTEPVSSIRFWGKIFGTVNNYIILETELKEDAYLKRIEEQEEIIKQEDIESSVKKEGDDLDKALGDILKRQRESTGEDTDLKSKLPRKLPPEPQNIFEQASEPPSEPSGIGLNKKVYYVCTEIGGEWIPLPDVKPKEIVVSRKIYKSFTGNLEHNIQTYPEFPGQEKNYLRAQIARITAGTQIAPLGYYVFGSEEVEGEEEEEEEGEEVEEPEGKTDLKTNSKYEPPPLKDLVDPSMSFWVHTSAYILPQGRVKWWSPVTVSDVDEEVSDEMMEEEEEEDKAKALKSEPETGPPLLTPCSEDASLETVTPWSVRTSSNVMDNYALAVVRSNLWPGAYTLSTQGKTFFNIYFGFGLNYMQQNFSPTPLPSVQLDYPIGPEILEVADPTGAEEELWRIDHLPKVKEPTEMAGEEAQPEEDEEEEEEEEEEEDEDE